MRRRELGARQPVGPVVHVHGQFRGEALRLPLPVPDQGHRTDQQGWRRRVIRNGRVLRVVRPQHREELDGLSQAHVVGEDGADAEPPEERQPGKPALLVGPQGAAEAGGRGHRPRAAGRPDRTAGRRASRRRPPRRARGRRACRPSPGPRRAPRPRSSFPSARARGTSAPPSGAGRPAPPTGRGRGRAGPCARRVRPVPPRSARRRRGPRRSGSPPGPACRTGSAGPMRPARWTWTWWSAAGRAAPCVPSPA